MPVASGAGGSGMSTASNSSWSPPVPMQGVLDEDTHEMLPLKAWGTGQRLVDTKGTTLVVIGDCA